MSLDESINFSKLELEFHSAKAADEKYSRENDAKFRAVHQKVQSYEEFRDIVAASHLKSLDRNDLSGAAARKQPWNVLYSTLHPPSDSAKLVTRKNESNTVDSCDKFYKFWKGLKTNEERCQLLFDIPKLTLLHIFAHDIPVNVMEETVKALKTVADGDNGDSIISIMEAFTHSKRFQLSLNFLSNSDKREVSDLLSVLQENGFDVSKLKHCYDILF